MSYHLLIIIYDSERNELDGKNRFWILSGIVDDICICISSIFKFPYLDVFKFSIAEKDALHMYVVRSA